MVAGSYVKKFHAGASVGMLFLAVIALVALITEAVRSSLSLLEACAFIVAAAWWAGLGLYSQRRARGRARHQRVSRNYRRHRAARQSPPDRP